MKITYKFIMISLVFLGGCASKNLSSNSESTGVPNQSSAKLASIHSSAVSKRLMECIVKSNQSADALLVDSQVIVVTKNNPNAKALFNSTEKVNDEQAKALSTYLVEANACRPIALEGVSPEMILVYEDFFKNIDRVYNDLIARKITIGVANQERQLLIEDARLKRLAIQVKKN